MPPPNHAWAAASTSTDKSHSRKLFSQSGGSTSAYTRHLQATDAYLRYYGGSIPTPEKARSERDILEENHQFIRGDDEGEAADEEKMMAKKYYDKLFKEFAVVELARWKEKQIAMRWRTKEEVLAGKGQFSCANLSCRNSESTLDENPDDAAERGGGRDGLRGFELMFEYVERDEKKSALVKVRVCDECTAKLRHIQGSGVLKERRKTLRGKDDSRFHHRSGSRNYEEGKRRKYEHQAHSRDRDRRKHRERRRSSSPKERDVGHMSRHHSPPGTGPRRGSPKSGRGEDGNRTT